MAALLDQLKRLRQHADARLGHGFARRHGLVGDVDHAGPALGIEMGEHSALLI